MKTTISKLIIYLGLLAMFAYYYIKIVAPALLIVGKDMITNIIDLGIIPITVFAVTSAICWSNELLNIGYIVFKIITKAFLTWTFPYMYARTIHQEKIVILVFIINLIYVMKNKVKIVIKKK